MEPMQRSTVRFTASCTRGGAAALKLVIISCGGDGRVDGLVGGQMDDMVMRVMCEVGRTYLGRHGDDEVHIVVARHEGHPAHLRHQLLAPVVVVPCGAHGIMVSHLIQPHAHNQSAVRTPP